MKLRTNVAAAVLLGVFALSATGQPRREIPPEEIAALQQQLSAITALKGKSPEELQKLLNDLQKMTPEQRKKFEDLLKNFGGGKDNFPDLGKLFPKDGKPPEIPNLPMPPRPPLNPIDQGNPFPMPPKIDDAGPQPKIDNNPFKNNNPFENFEPPLNNDQKLNANPNIAEMAKFWEKNFGPLDKSPAVRDALIELFEMSKDGKFGDGEWKDLLDEFNKNGNNADGFGDWFKEINLDGGKWDFDFGKGWDFPKFGGNWGGGNWGGGGGNWGGGGGGGGGMSFGGGGAGSWLPVILLVVIAVGALLAWKFWPMLKNRGQSSAAAGVLALGRWPVDPRTINSREQLVKAFEYLSVLLCGDAARVWNHQTIATALRLQIPTSELVADELAKLYELARYTPPGEPMSPDSLADARRCLCHLAGVSA